MLMEKLKVEKPVWVDEWVRRGNGDKYQIAELEENKTYKLLEDDFTDYNFDDNFDDIRFPVKGCNYMFLHIRVDKERECPYNINFKISFYETIRDAFKDGSLRIGKDKLKGKLKV